MGRCNGECILPLAFGECQAPVGRRYDSPLISKASAVGSLQKKAVLKKKKKKAVLTNDL
jgi:hypothetical protein